ncbi:uncharacterized protein LOC128125959 [Lactuca sativa]|uniref:uncharacterized protein LOC128125959 n=1 Tax=Lactuca sativa TaxID=4236 RepID=UPI0022AF9D44|nr:uncharacterized protein LOC128125959 [Lactuca sativa]
MTADEPVITATVAGTYLLDSEPAVVMFDSGATHSFVSRTFINRLGCSIGKLAGPMVVEVADNRTIYVTDVYRGYTLDFSGVEFPIDLIPIAKRDLCVIVGMDWLDAFDAEIHCRRKQMAPPARLNQLQMEQVRNIVAEEFNNAFNELIPGVTNDIINQVKALLVERLAAIPGGELSAPPVRDSA